MGAGSGAHGFVGFYHALLERLADRGVNDEARRRDANLAGHDQRTVRQFPNRQIQIGVGKDHCGSLAAEFKIDPLQGRGRRRHD